MMLAMAMAMASNTFVLMIMVINDVAIGYNGGWAHGGMMNVHDFMSFMSW